MEKLMEKKSPAALSKGKIRIIAASLQTKKPLEYFYYVCFLSV